MIFNRSNLESPLSAEQTAVLLSDLERYPLILKWWETIRVTDLGEAHWHADQVVRAKGFQKRFSMSCQRLAPQGQKADPAWQVHFRSEDQQFRTFDLLWSVRDGKEGTGPSVGASVALRGEILFASGLVSMAAEAYKDQAVSRLWASFEAEAQRQARANGR